MEKGVLSKTFVLTATLIEIAVQVDTYRSISIYSDNLHRHVLFHLYHMCKRHQL